MEGSDAQITLSQPQKRPLEDDTPAPAPTSIATPTRNASAFLSADSSPLSNLSSPALSALGQPTPPSIGHSNAPVPTLGSSAQPTLQPPAKRRKFTDQEKEQMRLEKEAKEKERLEAKAKREEEHKAKEEAKKAREEERKAKEEEKRIKAEEKEEKRKKLEEEKRKKEEEKQKKEKAQLRLNAFFVKPKPSVPVSGTTATDLTQTPSTQPIAAPLAANPVPPSPQKATQKQGQTDYERYFLPFELPSRAILAPYNRFLEDPAVLASAQARLDDLVDNREAQMMNLETFKSMFSHRGPRGVKSLSVQEIVERINGSSDNPIDLTEDGPKDPLELLKDVPMKFLLFPEDVRPPYYATYTKPHSEREARRLARNPFARALREADYDYDSEAEWEEPEEGEDLDSEGEEDLDEDAEDDLEGFLDDDDDPHRQRRLISGDLQPVSTGLCWEDPDGVSRLNDGSGAICTDFKEFRIGFLLEPSPASIDPFSTSYWALEPMQSIPRANQTTTNGSMNPPRLPLVQRPANHLLLNSLNVPTAPASGASTSKPARPPKRMIPPELLSEFKDTINGSDLTKIALIEALKKKFPKVPKDAISNTLSVVASRVGSKEVEKRWVLFS